MNYSIDQVARLTGVSAFSLRNWEKRYDFLRPKRLRNGFRVYTEEHLSMVRRVADLVREGARIGDLATLVQQGKPLPEPVASAKRARFAPRLRPWRLF